VTPALSAANQHDREARFEQLLGNLLRAGVLLAAAVVLLGGVLHLVRNGGERPDLKVFRGEPADLRNPAGIVGDALQRSGRGVIMAGLLLLVATPLARVGFSVAGFLRGRDFLSVVLALTVLAVLLYSLFFEVLS
jgi:uncharacterized membrane protein